MVVKDIILIAVAALLFVIAVLGCIIPGIPGTPIAWGGLLALSFAPKSSLHWWPVLLCALVVTIIVEILNNFIPAMFTKKAGGSKAGSWGSTIGAFAGIFTASPVGILAGPFLGAFIGELIHNSSDIKKALRSAVYSFLGFITGTGLRLITCLCFVVVGVRSFW